MLVESDYIYIPIEYKKDMVSTNIEKLLSNVNMFSPNFQSFFLVKNALID